MKIFFGLSGEGGNGECGRDGLLGGDRSEGGQGVRETLVKVWSDKGNAVQKT